MIPTGGTYRELERRWKALPASQNLHVREIACDTSGRALLCVNIGDLGRRAVGIAAGLHGDEPAGPWALLELVEADALDTRFGYRLWPCVNPTGFAARTRESVDGIDINRTFGGAGGSPEARTVLAENRGQAFVLSLDLHEDCEASGFYCYEYGGCAIGRSVVAAFDARGFPIDPIDGTFDLAGPLNGAQGDRERGRVVADPFAEAALLGGLSYSLALARGGARHALTFETPSSAAWELRIAMHAAATRAAIDAIARVVEDSASTPFK